MYKRAIVVVGLVGVCSLSVLARQSALVKTGVTVKDIQAWAMATMHESTAVDSLWFQDVTPGPSAAALKAIQAMGPAEKLALTQEVLLAIKSALMSPQFRAEHTARIGKQHNKAIDHGIDVNTYGRTGNLEADAMWTTMVPIIQMMRSFPPEALKNAYEEERKELAETIKNETGEDRAKAQKDLARLNPLAPLMKSNFEEFKKQYTVAKLAAAGGPDTEAKFQAATASAEDKQRVILEQTFWNRYSLNAMLKQDLNKFIDQATKMDFKAATRLQGGVLYWGDGSEMWGLQQIEAHLGAAATASAVQFARAWVKELK